MLRVFIDHCAFHDFFFCMNDIEQLAALTKERETYITRIFWEGVHIAILFALPLAAAVLLIKFVFDTQPWRFVFLGLAFIVSWILVIHKYRKLSAKMEGFDAEIRELRKKLDIKDRPEHKYPDEIERENESKSF